MSQQESDGLEWLKRARGKKMTRRKACRADGGSQPVLGEQAIDADETRGTQGARRPLTGSSFRRLPLLVRETQVHFVRDWFRFRGQRVRACQTYRNTVGIELCSSAALLAGCHVISSRWGLHVTTFMAVVLFKTAHCYWPAGSGVRPGVL